jgi:hypothetical protein
MGPQTSPVEDKTADRGSVVGKQEVSQLADQGGE